MKKGTVIIWNAEPNNIKFSSSRSMHAIKTAILAILLLITMAGCSTATVHKPFAVNTADFATATDINLCAVYGYGWSRADEAKEELVKRHVFTADEWQDIEKQQIKPGMSLCAVFAAFTNSCAKYNETKDSQGNVVKELIYVCSEGRAPLCPYTQVILNNDKVIKIEQMQFFK